MPSSPKPAVNTYAAKAVLTTVILVASLAIVVRAYLRGRVLQYEADHQKNVEVRATGPSMVYLQSYTGCDTQCTAAAGLIKQVKRIYETMDEEKPDGKARSKRVAKRASRREWLGKLAQYRKLLINPDNKQYVFVDERVRRKGKDMVQGKYDYITRAHIDPQQVNVTIDEAQRAVDKSCTRGRCDLKAIVHASFERTNLRDRRYAIIDYPWYDPVTRKETTKRAIIFRIRPNFVVGSGFTLTQAVTKPNVPLIAMCTFVYALFLMCAFVYPGLFYTHGHLLTKSYNPSATSLWTTPNTYIVSGTVALTLGVAYIHSRTIRSNEAIKTTKLVQQLSDRRYFAILLASLALALGFFASFQRKYERNILPALLISFLFSLLALLDLFGGSDNQTYLTKIHLTRTFISCSVLTLLWLFVTLTVQWQSHRTH